MRVTYGQAQAQNDGRPTCATCYAPCTYDREYRATQLCQSCYNDPLIIQRKELLHAK